jgi:hypothetical protein
MAVDAMSAIDALCDAQELVIRKVIASGAAIDRMYFPRKSSSLPGPSVLALIVLAQQQPDRAATRHRAEHRK